MALKVNITPVNDANIEKGMLYAVTHQTDGGRALVILSPDGGINLSRDQALQLAVLLIEPKPQTQTVLDYGLYQPNRPPR